MPMTFLLQYNIPFHHIIHTSFFWSHNKFVCKIYKRINENSPPWKISLPYRGLTGKKRQLIFSIHCIFINCYILLHVFIKCHTSSSFWTKQSIIQFTKQFFNLQLLFMPYWSLFFVAQNLTSRDCNIRPHLVAQSKQYRMILNKLWFGFYTCCCLFFGFGNVFHC